MNELVTLDKQLPDTLPELAKFALVGREKLAAVRAEIRAIEKVGLAKEVLEQKKAEAQEVAELVTLSEVKIGAMLKEIPKAQGQRSDLELNRTDADKLKPKAEVLAEIGIKPDTAERFQKMADHEDIVRAAIEEARQNDDIISRAAVLKKIDETKKPHVVNNSKDDEWYTPSIYIEAARRVMGSIDLDPASNDFANETVFATTYYDETVNGLEQEWFGNIWLNPPYSTALIQAFADKLVSSNFEQAIVLVNNATETTWFRKLVDHATAIIFTTGRIKYRKRDGEKGTPLQGQAFLYFGDDPETFVYVFSEFGWGCAL